MIDSTTIGIDLGGTNIRGGLVKGKEITSVQSQRIKKDGSTA